MSADNTCAEPSDARHLSRFGAATGAVGLINDVLDLYERANAAIVEYRDFDQKTVKLLVRFAREISRLETWCLGMGYTLDASGSFIRLSHQTPPISYAIHLGKSFDIDGELVEMRALLQDIIKIFDTLGIARQNSIQNFVNAMQGQTTERGATHTLTTNTPDHESLIGGDSAQTIDDISGRLRRLGIIPEPGSWHQRLKSIASRTHNRLEEKILALSDSNSRLAILLDRRLDQAAHDFIPACLNSLRTLQKDFGSQASQVNQDLADIKLALADLHSVYRASRGIDSAIHDAAHMSITSILFLREVSLISQQRSPISERDLKFDDNDHVSCPSRQVVRYQGKDHLLELNPDIKVDADSQRIERRLNDLARGLGESPEGFRSLNAVNYVDLFDSGEHHYGILYQLPACFSRDTHRLVSLRELLPLAPQYCQCDCQSCGNCENRRAEAGNKPKTPALEGRLQLAATLVKAFHVFQSSHWLHQGICSDNIVFAEAHPTTEDQPAKIDTPWVVGFEFARHITHDSDKRKSAMRLPSVAYQHPSRRKYDFEGWVTQKYRAEFDIYAIGRLLLEIAVWEIVDTDSAVDEALERLPEAVGSRYSNAVSWCLGLTADSPVNKEILRNTPAPKVGGWPVDLVRLFSMRVYLEVVSCLE